MANYINTETQQYPVSETAIRAAFPQTSFPSPFVPPDEFKVVFPKPSPSFDPITQAVREIAPVLTSKGHYEQAYEVVDLDAETVAANQARAEEQRKQGIYAQIAKIEAGQGRAVREAALGDTTHLVAIEAQIEALRDTL